MGQIFPQFEILWPAMVAGMLVLATHVPLGREVLQRGIVFLDLAIAQIAAFGVVAANTLWSAEHVSGVHLSPTLIAIAAAITGAMGLYALKNLEVRIQEAIIGILFILAATGSVLLLAADPHGGERLKEILVGQILWFQAQDLLQLGTAYGLIIGAWIGFREKLGQWLFYPLFAITITLSTQVVGIYLVFASLIIPSLATLNHQNPLRKGFAIGILGYGGGLLVSALMDLPAGAAIVWSLAIMALAYFLLSCYLDKDRPKSSSTSTTVS